MKKIKNYFVFLAALLALGMFSACEILTGQVPQSTATPGPSPTQTIDPSSVNLAAAKAILTAESILGNNASSAAISSNLVLPVSVVEGVSLTWSSSERAIIDNKGVVTAPRIRDRSVVLTATLKSGDLSENIEFPLTVTFDATPITVRPLIDEIWSRKAISFSGYRQGQKPGGTNPTKVQIKQDLDLLVEQDFGLIRMYGAGSYTEDTLEVIQENNLDIKMQLGAYISGTYAEAQNFSELDSAIRMANQFPDIVVAVNVGNEVLVSWSFVKVTTSDMVDYCRYVRSRVTQPITVNDDNTAYDVSATHSNQLVWKEIDYASMHSYAYWDCLYSESAWNVKQLEVPEDQRAAAMMAEAIAYTKRDYDGVRDALDSAGTNIPIVVGETGWMTKPTSSGTVQGLSINMAHPVNQAIYYNGMMEWAYGAEGTTVGDGFSRPRAMFYFSAFDEPWKGGDDGWGLWDKDRVPKYVLTGTGYAAADAVYVPDPVVTE